MKREVHVEMGWLNPAQARQYLGGMSERTFRDQFLKKGLPHVRLDSGRLLIKKADIDSFLDARKRAEDEVAALVDKVVADVLRPRRK